MLKLYNTLTRQKEDFIPRVPGKASIYVCGMTVYDDCHIGHGRMLVVFDMIVRFLRAQGMEVTYVRNITDVDDKIIQRANQNNEPIESLTARYISRMHEDENALLNLPPTQEPRATAHIPQMLSLIERLIAQGCAYIASNGDVYFDVTQSSNYGALAHQDLSQLQAGIRVDVLDAKRNPADFVLWKLAKLGEPAWDSPWGKGRPGWHIECSAMSMHCLGECFDLHGGGADLIFPHHQNEIAQSEGAVGHRVVNYWLHNGHIQINQEKMSKSLGNFFTVREVLKRYDGEVVRYFLLASHYRSPIHYSDENLNSAQAALTRFYTAVRGLPTDVPEGDIAAAEAAFLAAMHDDFNTPVALAVLFDLVRDINRLRQAGEHQLAAQQAVGLKRLMCSLGLLQKSPEEFFKKSTHVDSAQIDALIKAREAARANKQWAQADELRAELTALGVIIEDTASGTVWREA